MDISKIDKNYEMHVASAEEFRFYPPEHPALRLEGLPFCRPEGPYLRLPQELLGGLREELQLLSTHTAGAALRFCTDSRAFAVEAEVYHLSNLPHMTRFGECGFDLYSRRKEGWQFLHTFAPPAGNTHISDSWTLPETICAGTDYLLYFPLYSGVESVRLGLPPQASVSAPPRDPALPILFYGSSITQGACACRPGRSYSAMICRELDLPLINLGFSGNACGDLELAEVIGGLHLSAFVMDYDYNAPTPEFLAQTHEPFFKAVRHAQPDLPVLLLSRVTARKDLLSDTLARVDVIRRTYDNARAAGDTMVYFLSGLDFWEDADRSDCTLDLCHPNDLGFSLMVNHILPVLRSILNRGGNE